MKFSHFDIMPHEQNGQLMFKYEGGGGRYLGREEVEMWEFIQYLEELINTLGETTTDTADTPSPTEPKPKRKKKELVENETV